MHLFRFPRVHLCHAPTPIEPMPNLTRLLGGPTLWIKRDDCTGLATGGNKTRKLEFLIGAADAAGADCVVTHGAVQSNHVRQTAAAAARHGLQCVGVLEQRVASNDRDYSDNGNVLLDRLFGAELEYRPGGSDMDAAMLEVADRLKAQGGKPYLIPGGGSNATGALGYVACALEIIGQCNDMGLRLDTIVHATGSTGTQAGLVTGLVGASSPIRVLGVSVRAPRERQEANVRQLVHKTAELLEIDADIKKEAVEVNGDYTGAGYGVLTEAIAEAIDLVAKHEGILLDPVYTGKGMAGLIDLVRKGHFSKNDNILFVHTGGAAGLFGYAHALC
jgi:L-cysteate sulfo-lyase